MAVPDEMRQLLLAQIDHEAAQLLSSEKAKLLKRGVPEEAADDLAKDVVATWWQTEISEVNLEFRARLLGLAESGFIPDNVVEFPGPKADDAEVSTDEDNVTDLTLEALRRAAVAAEYPDGVPAWVNKKTRNARLNAWLEVKGAPAQSERTWRRIFNDK